MAEKNGSRGGYRPNAGRPKADTVALSIRVAPEIAERVRALAKDKKITLAEALVSVLSPSK